MRYYVSEKKSGNEVVIAICDEDILGKTFRNPPFILEVKEDFYRGTLVDENELPALFRKATILNLSGKSVVSLAQKAGLINQECILKIGKTLHAQMARM
jgi:hypothetical protein